jgi:hypothetical protein
MDERMKRAGFRLVLLRLGLAASADAARAADAPPKEYQIKAALLLQSAKFVEWPETAFAGPDAPFTVGIVGRDPFGPVLDETMKGERVRGRAIRILRFDDGEKMTPCHFLFISDSEADRFPEILKRIAEPAFQGKGPLTAGDFDRFATQGGVIRFAIQEGRIRLHINLDAATRARLKISSHLLKLATIVKDDKPQD